MEFEIGDDPQGQVDMPEGDRQGGLGDERLLFWQEGTPVSSGNAVTDALPKTQLGERV